MLTLKLVIKPFLLINDQLFLKIHSFSPGKIHIFLGVLGDFFSSGQLTENYPIDTRTASLINYFYKAVD